MKSSYKATLAGLCLALMTLVSATAHASLTVYTNRAQFESALSSFTVDSLNGVTASFHSGDVRSDYTISSPSMYGCINHSGCGNNAGIGFDNSYLWNYQGLDTFTFATAVNGFGFDFANPACCNSGSQVTINGITSVATSGFFGVISDTALTSFTVDQTSSYVIFDNVTYGGASVPEPTSLVLSGLALLGLGAARRKKA